MKIFIRKVLTLIVVMFVFFCSLETIFHLMNKDTEYSIKDNYIRNNGSRIKTLILGPSHTFYGVNPQYLEERTFNLSLQGQGISMCYDLLDGYLYRLNNLENLVFCVSWASFRSIDFLHNTIESGSAAYLYYNYYMEPNVRCDFSDMFISFNILAFPGRVKRYYKNHINPACDSLGWASHDYSILNINGGGSAIDRDAYRKDAVPKNIEYMTNIIEICKSHNIRLIVVSTPHFKTLANNIAKTEEYIELIEIMGKLQTEYDIEYYDFMQDLRFEPKDFFDDSHMSRLGAEKFSRILADTLQL